MINLDKTNESQLLLLIRLNPAFQIWLIGMSSKTKFDYLCIGHMGQELMMTITLDKKILGEVGFVGETPAKAAKAVKSTFGQLHPHEYKFLNRPGEKSNGEHRNAGPSRKLEGFYHCGYHQLQVYWNGWKLIHAGEEGWSRRSDTTKC